LPVNEPHLVIEIELGLEAERQFISLQRILQLHFLFKNPGYGVHFTRVFADAVFGLVVVFFGFVGVFFELVVVAEFYEQVGLVELFEPGLNQGFGLIEELQLLVTLNEPLKIIPISRIGFEQFLISDFGFLEIAFVKIILRKLVVLRTDDEGKKPAANRGIFCSF